MSLIDDTVQEALAAHMLPKLTAQTLSRLACVCQHLRRLVYDVQPGAWTSAAMSELPIGCTLLHLESRRSLQDALLRYTRAQQALRKGQWQHRMVSSFPEPQFSSSGALLACTLDCGVQVSNAESGQPVDQLQFGEYAADWLRFKWSNSSNTGAVLARSHEPASLAFVWDMKSRALQEQGWSGLHRVALPQPNERWKWEQLDHPQWSPDLSMLTFSEVSQSADGPFKASIYKADSGDLVWSSKLAIIALPVWRSDSTAVAFFSRAPQQNAWRHCEHVVSLPEGQRLLYTTCITPDMDAEQGNMHAFSPDGTSVISTFSLDCQARVTRIADAAHMKTVQGPGQTVLVPGSLSWAPDSLQVAGCCASSEAHHPDLHGEICIWPLYEEHICSIPVGKVATRELTGAITVRWSPDALSLAVFCPTSSMDDRIVIVTVASQEACCIVRLDQFALAPEYSIFDLAWSPDTSQIVISFVHEAAFSDGGTDIDDSGQQYLTNAIIHFVAQEAAYSRAAHMMLSSRDDQMIL